MKPFTTLAILVFSLIALLQLLRVFFGWEVTVNAFFVPLWASVVACLVAAAFAFALWRETRT
jgi:hypothetical protein